MKYLFYLLPLLLSGGYGCVTVQYDTLERIPDYPQCTRNFDTSAFIDFTPDRDVALNEAFIKAFHKHGYSNVVSGTRFQDTDRNRTKVVSLLYVSRKNLNCEKGRYLETHIIVLVRNPGIFWNGKLHYGTPRYFQAYSQVLLNEEDIYDSVLSSELDKVFRNLFSIEKFREALEPTVTASGFVKYTGVIPDGRTCWEISQNIQKSENADWHEAAKWAFWACEQGNVEAASFFLENCLFEGFIGDNQLFVKTLKKIAELGVPLGQVHYGLLFQRGKKVPQDNNAAYYWMKKAADQDYPVALYNLGVYHEDGIGVPQSRSMAIYWYQKAAGKGYKSAQKRLRELKRQE